MYILTNEIHVINFLIFFVVVKINNKYKLLVTSIYQNISKNA